MCFRNWQELTIDMLCLAFLVKARPFDKFHAVATCSMSIVNHHLLNLVLFLLWCIKQACCTYLSAFRPCNGFFRRHWGLALVYSWLRGLDRDDWLSKENWWSRQPLAITARQGCDEDEEVKDTNKEKNLKRFTSRRTRLKLRNEWKKNSVDEITSHPLRCWYGLNTFWLM